MKQKIIIKRIKKNYQKQREKIIFKTLDKYYNIKDYLIEYNKNGKPYLKDNKVFFNISHDQNKVVFIFDAKPIGIDIQFFRKVPASLKKFLKYENCSDKKMVIFFSQKEAIIKLLGESLKIINDININDYELITKIHRKYVISIATYKK